MTPARPPVPAPGLPAWPDVLAAALVGAARSGEPAEVLLDAAAAHALRRRAGVALLDGFVVPPPAPLDDTPTVGPAAAARADDLLAFESAGRQAGPLRDVESRLELLTEWLAAAAAAGRRLPPELLPAMLDAGRRHRVLRSFIGPVGGARVGWLAAQRADWSYASSATASAAIADGGAAWEFGSPARRRRYLAELRRTDPATARELLESAWDSEAPEDRATLLAVLGEGLSRDDEPLLERALDDRRKEVRLAALQLLGGLAGSGYADRMAARARAGIGLDRAGWIGINPPTECDRSMRRDGITVRPPGGVGERAWWLEEILARTPLSVWPAPQDLLGRRVSDGWAATLRRGLARAAAGQRDARWAGALVDALTAEVVARGHPDDRLLLEALYDALDPAELAGRAAAALRRGLAAATSVGVEHVLQLCPRPWPDAVVDTVFEALAEPSGMSGPMPPVRYAGWRIAALCELAALRLPADCAPRAAALYERLRGDAGTQGRSADPGVAIIGRFASTLRYRHDMLKELA